MLCKYFNQISIYDFIIIIHRYFQLILKKLIFLGREDRIVQRGLNCSERTELDGAIPILFGKIKKYVNFTVPITSVPLC